MTPAMSRQVELSCPTHRFPQRYLIGLGLLCRFHRRICEIVNVLVSDEGSDCIWRKKYPQPWISYFVLLLRLGDPPGNYFGCLETFLIDVEQTDLGVCKLGEGQDISNKILCENGASGPDKGNFFW
jgi:hypothetical protein